jgi:hypothetical protein
MSGSAGPCSYAREGRKSCGLWVVGCELWDQR